MTRRSFFETLTKGAASAALLSSHVTQAATSAPNIIVILADDLGFGDLGCYGSKIRTPNLDAMAKSGALFRNFCSASPVCSPSRAALMTGRYGVRSGIPHVLGPEQQIGMSLAEITLAQMLKSAGYRSMCVGKWHLGAFPNYLPTARGFDEYYGIPYSNDNFPSILLRNTEIIESPVVLETITKRYTEQAVQFIRRAKDRPFFLYMAHTYPHIPLTPSADFAGKSPLGIYGDVVEELDWSVGQVLAELKSQGIAENTLVVFTSDNGPWYQGSSGRLRGRKGDTFEGGMREPFLATWPGRIPAASVVHNFACMLDIFPTIAGIANAALPGNPMDGVNIWPMLTQQVDSVERPPFLYLDGYNLQCIRLGRWKLHVARYNGPAFAPPPAGGRLNLRLLNPELYDMVADPGESYDVSRENPAIVADILGRISGILLNLPPAVQTAWRDTLNRPTTPVNAGEWPTLKV